MVTSSSDHCFCPRSLNLEPSKSNLILALRAFLSFVIFSTRLTRGGDGRTQASLLVTVSLNSIRTNITTVQLTIYSSNTQVELPCVYGTGMNIVEVKTLQHYLCP